VGTAFLVETDDLDIPFVCHAPMYPPGTPDFARAAMTAILETVYQARRLGVPIEVLASPGLGTYTGNRHSMEAARAMSEALDEWKRGKEAHEENSSIS